MNTDLYAWMATDEQGREYPIAAIFPGLGHTTIPLVTARRELAEQMRPVAAQHAEANNVEVRLVRCTATATLDRIPPGGE